MIDPRIFRAYDIRGKAGIQLTEDACQQIGAAFGQILQEKYGSEHPHPTVAVGWDARTHSPGFAAAMIEGLVSMGCAVRTIGQTPSPVNYFTICHEELDAGVQITASHNPKEDNGIKLQIRGAESYSGEHLQDLRKRIEASGTAAPRQYPRGSIESFDAVTPYINFLSTIFADVGKGKKVVVDAGNGVAGPAYCEVLRRVGCEVTELYTTPDGTFPNHAADPSKHDTLAELQERVKDQGAHVGFAFDGDGDRLGVVDEKGQIVSADQTLLLLAKDHLERNPGFPVIFTVSNSSLLESEVMVWGGRPVMCKVGHSYVEHAMHAERAFLGGEQSGHFFCAEQYYRFDDAMVAALRVLSVLSKDLAPISAHIEIFPHVYQAHERRPHCSDDHKADVVARITEHFAAHYPVNTLDGARIDFSEGAWAGIRYSNTSPCLSICIEARSPQKLSQVQRIILEHLATYPEIVF